MQEFVRVASTGDLEPGQIMLADVDDKRIMLVNVDGQYYALQRGVHPCSVSAVGGQFGGAGHRVPLPRQ